MKVREALFPTLNARRSMLIRCPTCASGYDLDPEMLTAGRILRCAHCREAWSHDPLERTAPSLPSVGPEIVTEARFLRPPTAEPALMTRRPRPEPTLRRQSTPRHEPTPAQPRSHGLVVSLLAVAIVGSGMAAVAGKASLVAAFPPSEAVFSTLGLPVNLKGLGIADIRSTVVSGDGPPTLTLEGRITNLRPDAMPVPALRIAVRDKNSRELYYWTSPAPKAQLAAGETVLFHSRLAAPPADGQDLAVSFAEPSSGRRRVAEVMPGDR
ncbi:MAG: zinc-ribbon domain-containing protein [Janthinobacterium lividum]